MSIEDIKRKVESNIDSNSEDMIGVANVRIALYVIHLYIYRLF